ncbi:MAG: hypothetical protein Q7V63_00955 [Gammaproteobacteria bacterium]|nr:hypothetical protein [Gammaproteobacteria bacterium]
MFTAEPGALPIGGLDISEPGSNQDVAEPSYNTSEIPALNVPSNLSEESAASIPANTGAGLAMVAAPPPGSLKLPEIYIYIRVKPPGPDFSVSIIESELHIPITSLGNSVLQISLTSMEGGEAIFTLSSDKSVLQTREFTTPFERPKSVKVALNNVTIYESLLSDVLGLSAADIIGVEAQLRFASFPVMTYKVDFPTEAILIKDNISFNWPGPGYDREAFFGRESYQKALSENLVCEKQKLINIRVLSGLPGIGKTQIATYYFYKHTGYKHKIWFKAGSIDELRDQYIELAIGLGIISRAEAKESPDFVCQQVKSIFENSKAPFLIVYDNAESYHEILPYLPALGGDVLITSRNKDWPSLIKVKKMPEDEACSLVKGIFAKYLMTKSTDEDIKLLFNRFSGFPLMLAEAARYIGGSKTSINNYLKFYNEIRLAIFEGGKLPAGYVHENTWTTFVNYIKVIEEKNPEAIALLRHYASIASPDGKILASALPDETALSGSKTYNLNGKRIFLRNRYLLKNMIDGYYIHPLVRDIINLLPIASTAKSAGPFESAHATKAGVGSAAPTPA